MEVAIFAFVIHELLGPNGFDRLSSYVCKHAGSLGESLKR